MPYQTTTDHNEIQRWIERHGGKPAVLKGTTNESNFGALRIDFQDHPDLEAISWDAFFDRLESGNLAFSYNDEFPEGGNPEDHFKLVSRDDTAGLEDRTEMPDAGDAERADDNLYGSAPADEHQRPLNEEENDGSEQQTVW